MLDGFEKLSGRHELALRAARVRVGQKVRSPFAYVHEVLRLGTNLDLQFSSPCSLHRICEPRWRPAPGAQPRCGQVRRELGPTHRAGRAKWWVAIVRPTTARTRAPAPNTARREFG